MHVDDVQSGNINGRPVVRERYVPSSNGRGREIDCSYEYLHSYIGQVRSEPLIMEWIYHNVQVYILVLPLQRQSAPQRSLM